MLTYIQSIQGTAAFVNKLKPNMHCKNFLYCGNQIVHTSAAYFNPISNQLPVILC